MHAVAYLSPETPSRSHYTSPTHHIHTPVHSSPLASSPTSSPSAAASRRRAQFKSNPFNTPQKEQTRPTYMYGMRRGAFVQGSSTGMFGGNGGGSPVGPTEEPPRKTFLRERLKARCIERAVQKRERAKARGSRHMSSEPSSDGVDEMMDEDDEDEECMLNDEVGPSSHLVLMLRKRCAHVSDDGAVLSTHCGQYKEEGKACVSHLVSARRGFVV